MSNEQDNNYLHTALVQTSEGPEKLEAHLTDPVSGVFVCLCVCVCVCVFLGRAGT